MAAFPTASDMALPTGQMTLRVSLPGGRSSTVPLAGRRLVIGRLTEVEVHVDSDTVSRRHAELVRDPFNRWWVRDLGSRNGTRVNGAKVAESVVEPGDTIQLGECTLTIAAHTPAISRAPLSDAGRTIVDSLDRRIQRLRELEAPRIDHSHLTSIVEFGHQIHTTQDPQERLARLCGLLVSSAFRGRSAAVLHVPRKQPEQAQVIHGPQIASGAGPQPTSVSSSVMRAICESPEPVLATNVKAGPDQIMLTMPLDVMALTVIAAPLRFDDESLDLLYVTLPPECSSSDWLALVALAVKQYQQAEAVWLNVGKIKDYAVIRKELERAQQIQRRLTPRNLNMPGLELAVGFRACRWVGGDCVAVVPMADGRVLLAVADVCGKGLSAALVASCVHTLFHSAARAGLGLSTIVGSLNDYLCQFLGVECFATTFCVAIDPITGQCESVCAGHPRGIVVDPAGNVRRLNSENCPPLGITEVSVSSGHDRVAPGEVLVLFSDGVSELHDESNRMLGAEGLEQGMQLLYPAGADQPLEKLVEQVEKCLDAFQGRAVAQDDQTLLMARLKARI